MKEMLDAGATGASLHFWRTKDRAEVDFVVSSGAGAVPVEVKYQALKQPAVERSLRNFIEAYHPAKAYVIAKSFEGSLKIGQTQVLFLPFWFIGEKVPGTIFIGDTPSLDKLLYKENISGYNARQ